MFSCSRHTPRWHTSPRSQTDATVRPLLQRAISCQSSRVSLNAPSACSSLFSICTMVSGDVMLRDTRCIFSTHSPFWSWCLCVSQLCLLRECVRQTMFWLKIATKVITHFHGSEAVALKQKIVALPCLWSKPSTNYRSNCSEYLLATECSMN